MSNFKSHTPPTLTLTEKLGIGLATANALRATLQKVVTPSTYTSSELPPVAVQAQVTFFCMMFSLASTRQIQYTSPPSVDLYKSWLARSKQAVAGYEYAGEDLIDEDGLEARILWIGAPWKMGEAERKVVLYFHGGGFISPLNDGHLDFVRFLKENLKEKYGQDVAIGVVEYTLAPAKTYPMPMKQGVLALNHLLAKGCSPENIALSGDSAGGHLCLSIISHILHPHPDVTPVLPLIAPLAAAIIISGWVSFSETAESYTANEGIDLVSKAFVSYWVEEAFGKGVAKEEGAAGRHHVEALEAPETWWEGLGQAVKFVGLTGGRFELLRDCIVELGEKLKVKGALSAEVDVLIGKSEVHDGPLIDFMNGIQRPPSVISQGVADYLGEAFK